MKSAQVTALPPAHLHAQIELQRGARRIACELDVQAGETLALVGPNGAGKSSVLLALAGLLRLDGGRIEFAGQVFDDARPEGFLPPEARRVGMVFQDDRLFPHLTLLQNIGFACPDLARAEAWLQRIGLADRAADMPQQLSGGEGQRLALARALASDPQLLLLDEPLAAVDAAQRPALRGLLRRELADFLGVRILVSHDAIDAFSLADRIAVLEDGQLTQVGTVAEICQRPRSRFVADLIGLNLLHGVAMQGQVQMKGGGSLQVADAPNGPVLAVVHPRAIALFPERPSGSPRNVWQAEVAAIEASGDRLRVRFSGELPLVAEVTPAALAELKIAPGRELWLAVKATEISCYSA
jgi:molybdate transport system ATP-binding protein